MLTKILLTHTTKLNIAFKLTLPIPIGLYSISGVSSLSLARRCHCPRVVNKGSPKLSRCTPEQCIPKLFYGNVYRPPTCDIIHSVGVHSVKQQVANNSIFIMIMIIILIIVGRQGLCWRWVLSTPV